MAFKKRTEAIHCKICSFSTFDGKDFSRHLKSKHDGISFEDYAMIVLFDGKRPKCLICCGDTRFIRADMSFKKYCKEHSLAAMSLGGKKGGSAPCHFKGETKETSAVIFKMSQRMMGEKNHFYGAEHSAETKKRISVSKTLDGKTLKERLIEREHEFELLTPIDEYYSRQGQYLLFRCKSCSTEQKKTLQAFERGSLCIACYPYESAWSLEVGDFVKLYVDDYVSQDRTEINPKELDHFISSKKLAIECHGLYWHSELSPHEVDPYYHKQKWAKCHEKGIKLLSLFSDEWRDKKDICKSIIKHKLGVTQNKFHARKCKVVEITYKEAKKFFDENHLSGHCSGKYHIALSFDSKIIAAMTLRKPFQQSKYEKKIEIGRYAPLIDCHIHGGLSKLISHAENYAINNGYDGIVTYSDRRLGDGEGYEVIGFERIGEVDVDYFYTDGTIRVGRALYRADNDNSERQRAVNDKMGRIYGCGSAILLKSFSKI